MWARFRVFDSCISWTVVLRVLKKRKKYLGESREPISLQNQYFFCSIVTLLLWQFNENQINNMLNCDENVTMQKKKNIQFKNRFNFLYRYRAPHIKCGRKKICTLWPRINNTSARFNNLSLFLSISCTQYKNLYLNFDRLWPRCNN